MIIAVSGLTGSGKNTLGELLAKKLGYKLVCPTFKDLAAKEKISLMEFQKKAEKDHDIDKKFDAILKEQATGNCVVTTWLGPWIVEADIRIKVTAPLEVRAERVAKRDGMTLTQAKKHVKERDEENRMRYKKVYGIDIYDESKFDAILDNSNKTPEQLLEIALDMVRAKR
ncbi:Putative adenylate kinase [Candidatus Bilamarchaeum dharawalense]|uniref:Adenylate kinase n=1 Tax=Candidatus Bilamarchaeum dharawalense TaxID=2885759 RepID=A0A5E4LLV9_9ARCH|nr:Putative adenylate kinase [Candidatus Bilamarchaeum dharawalense]